MHKCKRSDPCAKISCFVRYQEKLIAGDNITIDENTNTISAKGEIDTDKYYNKKETDEKLLLKQNKLIEGDNITIDEKTNIISAKTLDLDDFYHKKQVDDKLSLKQDILKESESIKIENNTISTKFNIKDYYTKNEIDGLLSNYYNKISMDILLNKKQDLLKEGTGINISDGNVISCTLDSPLPDETVKRLNLILDKSAFAYNKVTGNLFHIGFWTQFLLLNDIDKDISNNNIITDEKGNDLVSESGRKIRRSGNFHYAQIIFHKENGDTIAEIYQDKFTYKDKEIQTKE